ncbi:MAG TPA: polyphosphate:AMP phosphotransferase [Candidatus Limnocylindrales bacterium]|nr:polyphosphate:AMP phosphotransferase [Candidatus Limnocylindrales bacterium]
MFESAEIGHRLEKGQYKREEPALRQSLLEAQYELLRAAHIPVVVLVAGADGAGKGETVNLFNQWMDPRHIHAHAFGQPTEEEAERPPMWRFWQALPPKGRIGILFGSWYTQPILDRVMHGSKRAEFERELERIRRLETMLAAEGTVLVKLWFHLSRSAQRDRLKKLSSDKRTAWRVTSVERKRFKHFDEFRETSEEALRMTSTGVAPWQVIDGSDDEYRALTAGNLLLDALRCRPAGSAAPPTVSQTAVAKPPIDGRDLLNTLDYTATLPRKKYSKKLESLQGRLALLMRSKKMRRRSLIVVFEGMDAAGKGSAIRRVTQALDARSYHVIPIAAPTDEERAQPYLWRFWRHIPRHDAAVIFDRSWYGRVLVERVEGFAAEPDWMRAYSEINDFESQLAESGTVLLKFWLAITPEEQLRRFKEREEIPFKRFKITQEDWRNRDKWPEYERAVCDMIEQTSTDVAPWDLIAANDKLHARVEVLRRICERIEAAP